MVSDRTRNAVWLAGLAMGDHGLRTGFSACAAATLHRWDLQSSIPSSSDGPGLTVPDGAGPTFGWCRHTC